MKSAFLFLMFLLTFSSCKKSEAVAEDMAISVNENLEVPLPPQPPNVDQVKFVKPGVANSEENVTVEKTEQKIIKEGNIKFETNDLEATYTQIKKNVIKSGATIQNDTEGKDSESVFRKLIVRVPSQNFDVLYYRFQKALLILTTKKFRLKM